MTNPSGTVRVTPAAHVPVVGIGPGPVFSQAMVPRIYAIVVIAIDPNLTAQAFGSRSGG